MSQQTYRPLIWTSCILLFILCIGGIFYVQHDRERRTQSAKARWESIQKKATASGIHTNFESYIEATSGVGPSLFNDFPALTDLFNPDIKANMLSSDQLPDIKSIPEISATMSSLERTEELRKCLTTPLPASASEKEVYQAVLNALTPVSKELEQWKSAVFASNNLGEEYFRENYFFIGASTFTSTTDLLLLRSHCDWHLGNTDSSDIECVLKTSDLLYDYSQSFIALSVAIALDMRANNTISTILHDPVVSPEQSAQLVPFMPTFNAESSFKSGMKVEYLIQTSFLTALAENTQHPHPFIGNKEPLRDEPQHLLEETRADLAEFQFAAYFGPSSISTKGLLGKGSDTLSSRIQTASYGKIAEILLTTLSIGVSYYLENSLKAQLQLETSKISAYVTLYQRKHGYFPESLDSLVPEFLSKLPTTPHTGSDFIYTKPSASDEIPTISAVIRIPEADDIFAQWPEAATATP